MTGSVIHNSMIIHANVTIPTSMAARMGSTGIAVPIVHRVRLVLRGRWDQGARQGRKVFRGSEDRLDHKVLKGLQALLAHRAL